MPRHEVVKKLWAVIKERELQDPSNKQYAICDDQLLKVIGMFVAVFGLMSTLIIITSIREINIQILQFLFLTLMTINI